jgi:cytochrome c553
MNRRTLAVGLPCLAALPLIAAFAGGWATITVENLPDYLVAKQPANLTFSIRQHGIELMRGVQPTIEARSGAVEYKAKAVATNRAGYYTAKLEVPRPGNWTVTINSGHGRSNVTLLPIPAVTTIGQALAALPEPARGERLFVAKGCLSCHVHGRIKDSGVINNGPNLTAARFSSDYLAQFLADPSVKTNWASNNRMPNLNLQDKEIAALIAFLNAGSAERQAAARR